MNRADIEKLTPGTDLDIAVALAVFGFKWGDKFKGKEPLEGEINGVFEVYGSRERNQINLYGYPVPRLPNFSTDMQAAWLVVQKFYKYRSENYNGLHEWNFWTNEHSGSKGMTAPTAPHAICLAALLNS